ncbi:MAG: PTS sugar transporter subunit IIA [Candidatus Tantalella remota]|nr:PTS sugar transporter subunit IIA [Candidatus Tantalella remota]
MVGKNQILTTQELADYMRLNEKTILKMAQKGELPGVKVGSQWRFHLGVIDRYIQKDIMHTPDGELDSILKTTNHLIPLSRLFDKPLIKLDMKAKNKEEVLSEMVEIVDVAGIISDRKQLLEELKSREEMLSTAVGNGIAIPHPRKPNPTWFKRPNILMARSEKGVDFDSPDNEKVHLFFMTCAPNMMVHLRLMAKISKLLHIEGVIDDFMQVSKSDEIIRLLLEMERKHLFPLEVV